MMNAKSIDDSTIASDTAAVTIITHRKIAASPELVWSSLRFYEDIKHKAPFLLRLMLPRPLPIPETSARSKGEETTLRYEDGHYAKRVTAIELQRYYEFEVIDQRLASDRGVRLLSGAYTLRELPANQTDLAITTRYTSRIGPRWFAAPIEAYLCRRLHAHLLDVIQAQAES